MKPLVLLLILAGCATAPATPPQMAQQQQLYASEQAYTAAAHSEAAVIGNGRVSPATAKRIRAADAAAYAALVRLRTATEAGTLLTGGDVASSEAEIEAFTALVMSGGL